VAGQKPSDGAVMACYVQAGATYMPSIYSVSIAVAISTSLLLWTSLSLRLIEPLMAIEA
jgi:hypothetical protein